MQTVIAMVQQAMQYIDETPDVETRIQLIETLNTVSVEKVLLSFVFFRCSYLGRDLQLSKSLFVSSIYTDVLLMVPTDLC